MIKNNRSNSSHYQPSIHGSSGVYSNKLKKYQNLNLNNHQEQSSYHQSQYAVNRYPNNIQNVQKSSRIIKQSNTVQHSRVNTSEINPAQSHVQKWGNHNIQQIKGNSQASDKRRSQKSQVNSQIDTLNRLRQQYQILKQVISEDQALQLTNKMSSNKSKYFQQESQQYRKLNDIPRQSRAQEKDPIRQTNQDIQMLKSLLHRTKDYYQGEKQGLIEKQALQIIQLQNALQQSSIKIAQLLTELSQKKQIILNMKQESHNSTQNRIQLNIFKQSQIILKKQLQQKNTKINHLQMKNKSLEQNLQTLELEIKLKDKEINALQKINMQYRGKSPLGQELQLTKSNFKLLENQFKQKVAEISELKEKNIEQAKQSQSRIQQSRIYFQEIKKSQVSQEQRAKFQLQAKLKQLQKVLQIQNRQKQSFIGDITNIKLNYKSLQEKYQQIVKQKDEAVEKNKQLIQKLQKQEEKLNKYKTQRNQLQSMKNSLIKQFQQTNRQSLWKEQKSRQIQNNLAQIKQNYRLLENQYKSVYSQLKHTKQELQSYRQKYKMIGQELQNISKQLQCQKEYSLSMKQETQNQALKLIQMFSLTQTNKAMQERINTLMENSHQMEKKLKQKEYEIATMNVQHKKEISKYKEEIQRFGILATQNKLENCHIVNSYQQKSVQLLNDIQQKSKEVKTLQQEMKTQRDSLVNQIEDHKKEFNKQIKEMANKLFTIVQQKQLLQRQIQHYMKMESQYRIATRQLKSNRVLTQSIDHLWKIKQAQYGNIDQIMKRIIR